MSESNEQFISEPLKPEPGTFDPRGMSRGEPGLPSRFTWRDEEYVVVNILEAWKSSGPEKGGGGEMYLRRHWYRVQTNPPLIMTVYCERQARTGKATKSRWFVYTIETEGEKDL